MELNMTKNIYSDFVETAKRAVEITIEQHVEVAMLYF
jgi:hypothetical protein